MSTRDVAPVRVASRLIWMLAGADPDLLAGCPVHERLKFSLICGFHLVIAGALTVLAGLAVSAAVSVVLFSYFDPQIVAHWIAVFVSVFVFVGIVRMLASGMRSFTLQRTRSGASSTVMVAGLSGEIARLHDALRDAADRIRPFIPGMVLAMLGTSAMLFIVPKREPADSTLMLAFVYGLQLIVILSPLSIASIWASPAYDRLLLATNAVATAAAPASTSPPAPSVMVADAAPSLLSDEQRDEVRGLQEAFNRNPRSLPVGRALIEQHLRMGALYETLPVFDALISAEPADTGLIEQKASIYKQLGDDVRYRKTLEQVDQIKARASFEENAGRQFVLDSLQLAGLGFFGNFKWQFQPGLNVLLGKNGYGKSHLLRALVAALQCEDKVIQEFFEDFDSVPSISVTAFRDGESVSTVRGLLVFEKNSFGKVPVLAIPDMRYIDRSRGTIGPPSEAVADLRSGGARHLLYQLPYEELVLNFLYELCLDYLDHRRSFDAPVFRLIEDSINTLARPSTPRVAATGKPEFSFHEIRRRDNARFDILVRTEGNESRPLSLQKASQGTLSVVAMVGLVYNYLRAVHHKVPEEEIRMQPGLVIIDEIDAHLHPSWQQRIVPLFRDKFPNVQFILTAHSPLVVAGAREGEVAVLRRGNEGFSVGIPPGHFIGATASEMYSRVFEIEEEKDSTYLQLGLLHMQKAKLEFQFRELEGAAPHTREQEMEFERLSAQLGDLRKFEVVRGQRENREQLENRNQQLEVDVLALQGKIDKLSEAICGTATPVSGLSAQG